MNQFSTYQRSMKSAMFIRMLHKLRWDQQLTIRARLFVLLIAMAVPFALYLGVSSWRQASEERVQAGERMLGVARVTAARLDDHIGDIRQLLEVIGQLAEADAAHQGNNDALLKKLFQKVPPQISALTVWDTQGNNVGASNDAVRDKIRSVRDRRFFQLAMSTSDFASEAPLPSTTTGEPVALFSLPILHLGKAVGVVAASTRLKALDSLLVPGEKLPDGAVITIMDELGVVVARSVDPQRWIGQNIREGGPAANMPTDGVREGRNRDGIDRIGGIVTSRRVPWAVYVGIPTASALAPVRQRLLETIAIGAFMLTAGGAISLVIGQRLANALQQLTSDTERLQAGNWDHTCQVREGGEIGMLVAAFNAMAHSLRTQTAQIVESEQKLGEIADNLPALISYLDVDGRFQFANREYAKWLDRPVDSIVGKTLNEVYGPDYAAFRKFVDEGLSGTRLTYERDFITSRNTYRVETTLIPHLDNEGSVKGLFALTQDVTENRRIAAETIRHKQRLSMALEGSGSALFDWDLTANIIFHSAQAAAMRGENALEESATPAHFGALIHTKDRPAVIKGVQNALNETAVGVDVEFRVKNSEKAWIWIRCKGQIVERNEQGRPSRLAGTYTDITQRRLAEDRLRHLATFDTLTGLPNRALFNDRLIQAMTRHARSKDATAVLYLDIDHFKMVNDTLGHEAGDNLLIDFALTLRECVRASDTVARLAGDEFTIILEGLRIPEDAETVARNVVRKVRTTLKAGNKSVSISTSIGIAVLQRGEIDPSFVLRRADTALYKAKQLGRNCYFLVSEPMLLSEHQTPPL